MIRVAVITVSDSVNAGTRQDVSGAALESRVAELGWTVVARKLVPDEPAGIRAVLDAFAMAEEADVVLTTGGTGVSLRDVTPEATRAIADREIPGFGELMRSTGRLSTKFASLSRGGAFTKGSTLLINLPGSPRGAVDSLNAVAELIPHAVELLHGKTEHQKPLP